MVELIVAVVCGLLGGVARAFQGGKLYMPTWSVDESGSRFFDPGFVGTIFIGVVAGAATWLFHAAPAEPGIDWSLYGWALVAGVAGDIAIDYYVNQKYGESDQQGAGEAIDQMASATDNQSRVIEQEQKERRELQEKVDELQEKVNKLQEENDLLKKSGASED